jgi:hypothetical protein
MQAVRAGRGNNLVLGGDDGYVAIGLDKDAFEGVQAGNQLIVKVEAFEVFQRGGFPQVEPAGVVTGRNEGEFDAGGKSKNAVAGDLEVTIRGGVMKQIMFLSATHGNRWKLIGRQQQAQTFCPFTKVSFLPGDCGRPRCAAIWRYASAEVIERRADKIPLTCSRERRGLTAG